MDTRTGHRVGLTPLLMRLAASYIAQGLGRYAIDHPEYDTVDVTTAVRWGNHAREPHVEAYRMVLRVTFSLEDRPVRWVEFNTTITGAGGAPTFQVVPDDDFE